MNRIKEYEIRNKIKAGISFVICVIHCIGINIIRGFINSLLAIHHPRASPYTFTDLRLPTSKHGEFFSIDTDSTVTLDFEIRPLNLQFNVIYTGALYIHISVILNHRLALPVQLCHIMSQTSAKLTSEIKLDSFSSFRKVSQKKKQKKKI